MTLAIQPFFFHSPASITSSSTTAFLPPRCISIPREFFIGCGGRSYRCRGVEPEPSNLYVTRIESEEAHPTAHRHGAGQGDRAPHPFGAQLLGRPQQRRVPR